MENRSTGVNITISRSTLFPSKRIRIDLRKIKWNQKYEEDVEIEALLDSESESETEPDPEPRKVNCNFKKKYYFSTSL